MTPGRHCRWWRLLCVALLVPSALTAVGREGDAPITQRSEGGHFTIGITSRLQPIEINRIHSWVIHLRDAAGAPIDAAEFEVSGGMPAHDHGLPTRPRVTTALGGGDYLLEGLRFHMPGAWQVVVDVDAAGLQDRVVIGLIL
jgi:hypothetical protein